MGHRGHERCYATESASPLSVWAWFDYRWLSSLTVPGTTPPTELDPWTPPLENRRDLTVRPFALGGATLATEGHSSGILREAEFVLAQDGLLSRHAPRLVREGARSWFGFLVGSVWAANALTDALTRMGESPAVYGANPSSSSLRRIVQLLTPDGAGSGATAALRARSEDHSEEVRTPARQGERIGRRAPAEIGSRILRHDSPRAAPPIPWHCQPGPSPLRGWGLGDSSRPRRGLRHPYGANTPCPG